MLASSSFVAGVPHSEKTLVADPPAPTSGAGGARFNESAREIYVLAFITVSMECTTPTVELYIALLAFFSDNCWRAPAPPTEQALYMRA
jgi:hypothetical protein